MAVMFQVEVFWFVTPCNIVVGYFLHLNPEDGSSMDLLKLWYPTITLHIFITQRTST